MMRYIAGIILSFSLVTAVQAMPGIMLSDVSAGLFRFQIKLAEQGNPEAQYKVGEMYELGKGVAKNIGKAKEWYEKSAKQGHKKAGYKLLFIDIQVKGVTEASKSQLASLRQEAASGNADAQYFLGKMYATGTGVPKSLDNALTWLNKATFNGIPEAEHEAIAIEEELIRVRDREARKKAAALEASKKQKQEEARIKEKRKAEKKRAAEKKAEEKKRLADQKKRKANDQAEANRLAAERRRVEQEKAALAAERARIEKERQQRAAAQAKAQQAQATQAAPANKKGEEAKSFKSDPCKGKQARFLSTCR